MTVVILETTDGEYVHSAEVAEDPPELVIWNQRYFLGDDTPIGNGDLTYTEIEPLLLPFDQQEARPAGPDDA